MFKELFTESIFSTEEHGTKDEQKAKDNFLKELKKAKISYSLITKNQIDPEADPIYSLKIPRGGLVKLTNQLCKAGYKLNKMFGSDKEEIMAGMKQDGDYDFCDDENCYNIGKKTLIVNYGHAKTTGINGIDKLECK